VSGGRKKFSFRGKEASMVMMMMMMMMMVFPEPVSALFLVFSKCLNELLALNV